MDIEQIFEQLKRDWQIYKVDDHAINRSPSKRKALELIEQCDKLLYTLDSIARKVEKLLEQQIIRKDDIVYRNRLSVIKNIATNMKNDLVKIISK